MSLLTGTSTSRISQMVVRPWDADLVVFFFLQPCKIAESLSEQWNQQTRGGETTSVEKGILLLHGFNINGMMAPMGCHWEPRRSVVLLLDEVARSPVEVGSLSHYLEGFIHPMWLELAGFPKHQP